MKLGARLESSNSHFSFSFGGGMEWSGQYWVGLKPAGSSREQGGMDGRMKEWVRGLVVE